MWSTVTYGMLGNRGESIATAGTRTGDDGGNDRVFVGEAMHHDPVDQAPQRGGLGWAGVVVEAGTVDRKQCERDIGQFTDFDDPLQQQHGGRILDGKGERPGNQHADGANASETQTASGDVGAV